MQKNTRSGKEMHMRNKKYVLTLAVALCLSIGLTGCKPSKEDVVESDYYQELKEENNKLSNQLKTEKKKTNSLEKKIQAIHETSGDQKLAEYKRQVADSNIMKVVFGSKEVKGQSFAVINTPVCNYVKGIVADCYRMIGISANDLEKEYDQVYSYALIDEDNTTYEFNVYGNSYIVFDAIPANVYAFNNASVVGDGLIDAKLQKKYSDIWQHMADAQIVVSDEKMKFNSTAIRVSKLLKGAEKYESDNAELNTDDWNEYRFYTYGTVIKLRLGNDNIICVEKKNEKKSYYQLSDKNMKKLEKILK